MVAPAGPVEIAAAIPAHKKAKSRILETSSSHPGATFAHRKEVLWQTLDFFSQAQKNRGAHVNPTAPARADAPRYRRSEGRSGDRAPAAAARQDRRCARVGRPAWQAR